MRQALRGPGGTQAGVGLPESVGVKYDGRIAGEQNAAITKTMHPDTLAALVRLAEVLADHPEDMAELAVYGRLPEHLADVIEDHAPED